MLPGSYDKGRKVSDAEMRRLPITRGDQRWNYTVHPDPLKASAKQGLRVGATTSPGKRSQACHQDVRG
jgi:hypothetical protein